MFSFRQIRHCPETRARTGIISTARGKIRTPVFMPVGTLGTVKSLSPEDLLDTGTQIILGNTYHLYLRPGCDVLGCFSGLHRFMKWNGPILTDSGGFQIYSLARLNRIDDEGAVFQSHIDGSRHFIGPEKAIDIQLTIDSDIVMPLDQCIGYPAPREAVKEALTRTLQWAERCRRQWRRKAPAGKALFGIVQGGMHAELRRQSMESLADIGFEGYAVGGLSVGEPTEMLWHVGSETLGYLPKTHPRYVMGVGKPEDLVELVAGGADMFDCVLPTRNARNGYLFTRSGRINLANACHRQDTGPVDEQCGCYTCRQYSRAYLRHLFIAKELLAYRLNSIHNIYYFNDLMKRMRAAIEAGRFGAFRRAFHRDLAECSGDGGQGR